MVGMAGGISPELNAHDYSGEFQGRLRCRATLRLGTAKLAQDGAIL
jgi:hypothetical protein